MRKFQESPRMFFTSLFLPFAMAALVLTHTGFLFFEPQNARSVVDIEWADELPAKLCGFPFVSGAEKRDRLMGFPVVIYWPGVFANVVFVGLCTGATFLAFNRERKKCFNWRFGVKAMFRCLTFISLIAAAVTQLSFLDNEVFPPFGLLRSYAFDGLPMKLFLFIGLGSIALLITDGILNLVETCSKKFLNNNR